VHNNYDDIYRYDLNNIIFDYYYGDDDDDDSGDADCLGEYSSD
jgi:hypothetical protein